MSELYGWTSASPRFQGRVTPITDERVEFKIKGDLQITIQRGKNMRSGFRVSGSWEFINERQKYHPKEFSIDYWGQVKVYYDMPETEEMNYTCSNLLEFMLQAGDYQPNEDIRIDLDDDHYLINCGIIDDSRFAEANAFLMRDIPLGGMKSIVIYHLDDTRQELMEAYWLHSV